MLNKKARGTSLASPIVVAFCALLHTQKITASNDNPTGQLKDTILNYCKNTTVSQYKKYLLIYLQ